MERSHDMNINYMRYFVRAIDMASIQLAAEEMFITPQGLNQALQRIEREYNTKLYYRDGNTIRPTKVGEKVYNAFRGMISVNDQLMEDIDAKGYSPSKDSKNTLTVYSPPILTATMLTRVVPLFSKKNPQVRLRIFEVSSRELSATIDNTQNMLCLFGTTPSNVDSFSGRFPELSDRHPFYRTRILACVSKKSPLISREEIHQDDFHNRDVVLCRNERYFLRSLYPGFSPSQVIMSSQNKELCFAVIAENKNTIGFTNAAELFYCSNKALTYIPIKPGIDVVFGALASKEGMKNPAVQNFKSLVEAEFDRISQFEQTSLLGKQNVQ